MSGTAQLFALCSDNIRQLAEIDRLLDQLDAADYTAERFAADPVGRHVRHVLEHYDSLLAGIGDEIDYETRARDHDTERDPAVARGRLHRVRKALAAIPYTDPPADTTIRYTPAVPGSEVASIASSLERELHFALSHTVHHMALIALLIRYQGQAVDEAFGVAGSTLRYREMPAHGDAQA